MTLSLLPTRAVLFDMDGVLIDSEPLICRAAMAGLAEFGIHAQATDFLPFVGAGEDRYIGGVAEAYGKPYVLEMKRRVYARYLELVVRDGHPFPGVPELLGALQARKILFAVASSADRIKVDANLLAMGVPSAWFGAVLAGEDVTRKKPAPDLYLAAAARLGVAPAACCVVEDAIHGVAAARAAGMRCAAVATSFPAAQLLEAGAQVVRIRLAELTLADLGVAG
ncbi:MAG: HAD-IA family hydrolase [bacterium]